MRQNINHTDRVIWVSRPDTIAANVARLESLTSAKFLGPHMDHTLGVQTYVANAAGMQMMAPAQGSSAAFAQRLSKHLTARGEGVFGVVFGVADLAAAKQRAIAAGFAPTDFLLAAGDEPWASEIGKVNAAIVGEVMNVTFIFADIKYPDHLISDAGGFADTRRNNNRLDHFAWVCLPENLERYVALLSQLGDTRFDGPHGKIEAGIYIALSWETGLEIVSPIPGATGRLVDRARNLLKPGEGVYAVLYGVPDLEPAVARARAVGCTPTGLVIGGGDPTVPWVGKYKVFHEIDVCKFMNTDFLYCMVEYPDHVFRLSR
jgi:hypothetical protein